MRVLVLNQGLKPMMPCHPARARMLLKKGKAKVYRRYPFTIVLQDREEFATQPVELKIDPGSRTTGMALVGRFQRGNEVLWAANLEHRGHIIKDALKKRRDRRRFRRYRKTRYRPKRLDNRRCPEGWIPPSLMSRVNNVKVWAERLCRYAPVSEIHMETAKFDTQKMQNPEISGIEYQQGTLQGYDVREYLLEKFNRTCVYCGAQNVRLEVEHLIPRSRGGSDRVTNLVIACQKCNDEKNNRTAEEFGFPHLMERARENFAGAATLNAIRYRISITLKELGLPVHFWTGSRTKMNRMAQHYPKDHWIDAACVGTSGENVRLNPYDAVLLITSTGRGSRQVCRVDRFGFPRTGPKRVKRVHGFQTGDMVRLTQPRGKYRGVHEGKVAVRERGDFDILTPSKIKITSSYKNFTLSQRSDGYAYGVHRLPSSVR